MRCSAQRLASSAKRIVFIFILLISIFYFLPSTFPVHAQQTTANQIPQQTNPYLHPNTTPDVTPNLHNWTQSVMIEVMAGLVCQLTGIDPTGIDPQTGKAKKCLGHDPTTGKIGFYDPSPSADGSGQVMGAIGVAGNLIAMTFTHPPVSTGTYLAYMGDKFGIVEPAYAQGTGFKGISPIVKIWEAFRNITYLAFVIVFVVIGFMIMLRVKIDPRTVMTVQNSIPKIIVSIILVTFSFAIAGLLIDLMYVSVYLTTNLLVPVDPRLVGTDIANLTQASNPIEGANILGGAGGKFQFCIPLTEVCFGGPSGPTGGVFALIGPPANAIGGIASQFADNPFVRIFTGAVSFAVGKIFGAQIVNALIPFGDVLPVSSTIGTIIGAVGLGIGIAIGPQMVGGIFFLLAGIIIFIAVLWSLFRLWIQLLTAYIWILIDIVFAPLWVLAGMLPGSPISFSAWLRDIIANLSVFPTTIGMFILARLFMDAFAQGGTTIFVPPLVGPANPSYIGAFIGLGIILLSPQVLTMVKDALKAPKFPYGAAVGQAIAVGPAIAGGTAYAVASPYGTLAQFRQFRGLFAPGAGWRDRLGAFIRPQVGGPEKPESKTP